MSNELLDTSVAVHAAYAANIKILGGEYNLPYNKHLADWMSTAEIIIQLNANPQVFVAAQFSTLEPNVRLQPRNLHYPKSVVITRYHEYIPDKLAIDYSNMWHIMTTRIAQCLRFQKDRYTCDSDVLLCPYQAIPGWFRLLYFARLEINDKLILDKLHKMFLVQALAEIAGDQSLQLYLKENDDDGIVTRAIPGIVY